MNNPFSKISLLASCMVMLLVGFLFYPKWQKSGTEATLSWDVSGYYMYLPAIFIYQDLKKQSFQDEVISKYRPSPQYDQAFRHQESGNYIMKSFPLFGESMMVKLFLEKYHIPS